MNCIVAILTLFSNFHVYCQPSFPGPELYVGLDFADSADFADNLILLILIILLIRTDSTSTFGADNQKVSLMPTGGSTEDALLYSGNFDVLELLYIGILSCRRL